MATLVLQLVRAVRAHHAPVAGVLAIAQRDSVCLAGETPLGGVVNAVKLNITAIQQPPIANHASVIPRGHSMLTVNLKAVSASARSDSQGERATSAR